MKLLPLALACVFTLAASVVRADDAGFVDLFNGKDTTGWVQVKQKAGGYGVKDGVLFCTKGETGNLTTEKEYSNFILRLDFKLDPAANNGIGLRFAREAHASYDGMEIQILDDDAPVYANLHASQYCGSIYDVFPAQRGALKPVGQWNQEEITADGRHVKVVLNGQTIVDADLDTVTDPAVLKKHPGLQRTGGCIGLLSHNDYVEFRNIKIKELPATAAK
jgi:hypothetical protein